MNKRKMESLERVLKMRNRWDSYLELPMVNNLYEFSSNIAIKLFLAIVHLFINLLASGLFLIFLHFRFSVHCAAQMANRNF